MIWNVILVFVPVGKIDLDLVMVLFLTLVSDENAREFRLVPVLILGLGRPANRADAAPTYGPNLKTGEVE